MAEFMQINHDDYGVLHSLTAFWHYDKIRLKVSAYCFENESINLLGRFLEVEIRKLTIDDQAGLDNLINTIETNLERRDFWLPINTTSREHFFDSVWTEFYGIFHNSKLIAASALFYNKHEFKESAAAIGMENTVIAEIGRCMVHPDFRGKNLLYKINCELLKVAAEKRIECILATIHPDNLPSQKSFQKLGLKKELTYTKSNGYVRDIYTLKL